MLSVCRCVLAGFLFLMISSVCAAEPLRIGVSLGLTGAYALTSGKQKSAYELFEDDVNDTGGILGRKVNFIILDNQSVSEKAVAQYTQLIVKEKVDFVFGPYTSRLTLDIAPVVDRYGYPTLASGAAADSIWQQGYSNVFGMWTPASRYVLGFLKLLVYYELDRIVIVSADGAFAAGLAHGAEKWARALRLNILDHIVFKEGLEDFSGLAAQVKSLQPKVLICTGHYYVGASMKKALQKVGFMPKVFYATVSPTFEKYYVDLGAEAEADFSTAIWEPHPRLRYPGSNGFVSRYMKRFGESPTYHAASAYAAGEVLKQAIETAGTTEHAEVRKTLQSMNTQSIIGRYAVDRTGIQIKRFPLIVQWQAGKKEIVWPMELQTSPVIFRED